MSDRSDSESWSAPPRLETSPNCASLDIRYLSWKKTFNTIIENKSPIIRLKTQRCKRFVNIRWLLLALIYCRLHILCIPCRRSIVKTLVTRPVSCCTTLTGLTGRTLSDQEAMSSPSSSAITAQPDRDQSDILTCLFRLLMSEARLSRESEHSEYLWCLRYLRAESTFSEKP